jgi:hypothetical protein
MGEVFAERPVDADDGIRPASRTRTSTAEDSGRDAGVIDCFGATLPPGSGYDIGAHERP